MTPAIEHDHLATILFWVLMLPIAAYILHAVANFCTDDAPTSFGRAIFLVLVTAAAVFFAWDLSGYLFALLMRDPTAGIVMPQGFTYWDWLREPVAVKWNVLGFLPFIRYLPVFVALIIGCIVQVFMWNVEFKLGAVVFIAQLVLNIAAMYAVSFLIRHTLDWYASSLPPAQRQPTAAAHSTLHDMEQRVQRCKGEPSSFWRRLDTTWESFNGHLAPMYRVLQPVTNHLPRPAHDFLNAGGWLLVVGGTLGLIVSWPRIRRNRKEYFRPRKKRPPPHPAQIKLALIGDAVSGLGARQSTVNGAPARLRLVVVAPPNSLVGNSLPEMLPELLDAFRPDLAAATAADFPRVELWPDALARSDFANQLSRRIEFPDNAGQPSKWVVLHGTAHWQGATVPVGLALLTASPSTERRLGIADGKWVNALGIREVPIEERD